ncbi:MAG: glutaredoxin 3 [Cellvibrionaceae bacterium]
MSDVTIYSTQFCPFCVRAKQLLDDKGVRYRNIAVDKKPQLRQEMMQKSGRRTVPQIFLGKEHIGGCDELYALERAGKLDKKLEQFLNH